VTPNAATAIPGGSLPMTDTVKNQGPGVSSGSFRIGYYLSLASDGATHDVVITTIRTVTTPLAVGGTNSATTNLSIPSTAPGGTYYLCAVADSVNQVAESDETNNRWCSSSQVSLPLPDLIVNALSTSATTATAGTSISVANTITNQGGASAGRFVVAFKFSPTKDYNDAGAIVSATTRTIGSLSSGGSSGASTSVVIPAGTPAGAYYLCAKADDDVTHTYRVAESDEGNNTACTAAAVTVTSSTPSGSPDLVMTAVTPNAATAKKGGTLSVTTTVSNLGGATGTTFRIGFHLSGDATYGGPDDVAITVTRVVKYGLGAGDSSPGTTSLTLPGATPSGVYYVCTWADSLKQVAESNEGNNTLCSTTQVTVP
jgi:subtilase family serine protease